MRRGGVAIDAEQPSPEEALVEKDTSRNGEIIKNLLNIHHAVLHPDLATETPPAPATSCKLPFWTAHVFHGKARW